MAFKLPFNLPTLDRRNPSSQGPAGDGAPAVERRSNRGNKLPLIGHLEIQTQFRILGTVFLISLLITIGAVFLQVQATSRGITYLSVTSQLSSLTQQIPIAALNAMQGQTEGFAELRDARDSYDRLLERLTDGGEIGGIKVAASSIETRPALDALRDNWNKQKTLIGQLLAMENRFAAIGHLAKESKRSGKTMSDAAAAGGNLPVLTERILRAIPRLAGVQGVDEAAVAALAKDLSDAIALAPAGTPMADSLNVMQLAIANLSGDLKPLQQASSAGNTLIASWREMTSSTETLVKAYEAEITQQDTSLFTATIFGSLALLMLVLMAKAFNDEGLRRSGEANHQRRVAEAEKDATQGAILRLMNEMGDLADGDLTVRATVSEDITGAIADSVNYTVEELAVLVRRINDAALRVTNASNAAQTTSNQLLAATEVQSTEIKGANVAVLEMADSMKQVSSSALESARVANASLEAAQKGSAAVSNSIAGMNEIRTQIQDVYKRQR